MLYNKIRLLMLLCIVWTTPIPQTDLWQKAISIYFDYRVELIKCILSYVPEWPDESVLLYHRIFPVTLTNSFSFQNLFSDVFVWKWGSSPQTSSRFYHGNKNAATYKKGIFVHPRWVPNCMQNLKGGWNFSFPKMFDSYRDSFLKSP